MPDDDAARTWAVPDQPEGVTTVWDCEGDRWDYDAAEDGWLWADPEYLTSGADVWRWVELVSRWGPLTDRAPVTEADDGQ